MGEGLPIWCFFRPESNFALPFDSLVLACGCAFLDETEALPSIDMAANGEFVVILGRTVPITDIETSMSEIPQFWSYDANFQATHDVPHWVVTPSGHETPYSLISALSLNDNGDLATASVDLNKKQPRARKSRAAKAQPQMVTRYEIAG